MIGALLSNTPANLLRSSGVAGEAEPGSGGSNPGRDGASARDSLASPRAAATTTGNVPVLTSQAVLALQDADGLEAGRSDTRSADGETEDASGKQQDAEENGVLADAASGQSETEGSTDGDELSEAEQKQVDKLAQRDREVKAHEHAHSRTGGAYAGAPSYTFQQGPDGKRYAVGGEVQIDTSKERTPEATARKMQIVIRAATAPAEPSSQDLKVAQQARAQLAEAQAEVRQQSADELSGGGDEEEKLEPGAQAPAAEKSASENSGSGSDAEAPGQSSRDSSGTKALGPAGEAAVAYQSAVERTNEVRSLIDALVA